ncbi:uncharacterized protein [Drosophila kikkawai]|uniref:Uncharacterized protein n=1 Tax=Drosophila kikkawai TaxID=30033 RepID=A0A6P4IAW1_DROKI|nr:uncharacterized protein LOC108073701 [Drosophila kikkawai]
MQSLKVLAIFVIVLVSQQARASPLIDQSENDYVQPEARNLLGDVLGGVGTGLGDLANAITSLSVQKKPVSESKTISISAASLGELMGNVTDVAVAGQKFLLQLEVAVGASKTESISTNTTADILSDLGNALVDLATSITTAESNVQFGSSNVLGDVLNGIGNGLQALGNSIANVGTQMKAVEQM